MLGYSDKKRAIMEDMLAGQSALLEEQARAREELTEYWHQKLIRHPGFEASEVTVIMRIWANAPQEMVELYQPMPPILDGDGNETGEFEEEGELPEPTEE